MKEVNLLINFVGKNYYETITNVPVTCSISRILTLLLPKICENPENINYEELTIVSSGFVIPLQKSIAAIAKRKKNQITIFVKGDFEIKEELKNNLATFHENLKKGKKEKKIASFFTSSNTIICAIVLFLLLLLQYSAFKVFSINGIVLTIIFVIILHYILGLFERAQNFILLQKPEAFVYFLKILSPTWDTIAFIKKYQLKQQRQEIN